MLETSVKLDSTSRSTLGVVLSFMNHLHSNVLRSDEDEWKQSLCELKDYTFETQECTMLWLCLEQFYLG